MNKVKELFNVEIKEGFSVTSKHFSISPLFQVLPKNRLVSDVYYKILDNSISEYMITKTYENKDYTLTMNMIEMNNTTDELLLLTLLSFNRDYIEIEVKKLAELMYYKKESGKSKTKNVIMNSVNKLLKCSMNIKFKNNDEIGFHILKYKYNSETNVLCVTFDQDFINLYARNNLNYISLENHKNLKTDYEKSLYSLISNFYSNDNKISINKKVMFDKFGDNLLDKNKKNKINEALKSLKDKKILKTFNFSKTGSLMIIKNEKHINVVKKENKEKVVKLDQSLNNIKEINNKFTNILKMKDKTIEEIVLKKKVINNTLFDFENGLNKEEKDIIKKLYSDINLKLENI